MKKVFLLILFLGALIGLVFLSCAAEEEITLANDKEIEALIDEAMKDLEKLTTQAPEESQPKTEPEEASLPKKETAQLTDLEFNQANLEDVLRVIAEAGGMNIVLDPALKGKKIDLNLRKISIKEALELIYNAYGLGFSSIGNTLFISTQEKIKKGTIQTKIMELKNINVDEAKALLSNLVNTINVSKEINTLLLIGPAEDIAKAEKILKEVDIPQPQVLLEARVIEVNDDVLRELGIDWSDSITTAIQETARETTLSSPATATENILHIYKFARNAIQFEATLKMLEQKNKAKVLSSPRITTLNNKEAEIFIGDKIPYTITTVTGGAASTEVRFVEPGIRLKITPSIIEKDFVVIKIEPEVSYIYGWRGTGDQYPWVKSREAVAYVRVKDTQPFIIGGLLSKEDKKNLYKVPFLGNIPLLGNLFTYEKKIDYKTDLIITVTPTVISERT